MYPVTLAKNECANFEQACCTGIVIHDDLTQAVMPEFRGKPCVLGSKQRCPYLEETVIPLIDLIKDEYKHKEYSIARRMYFQFAAKSEGISKTTAMKLAGFTEAQLCPECKKEPRPKGYSRCPACARKRRKNKDRLRKQQAQAELGI